MQECFTSFMDTYTLCNNDLSDDKNYFDEKIMINDEKKSMKSDDQIDDLSVSKNLEIMKSPFERVTGNSQNRSQRHLSAEKEVADKQQSVKGRIKAIENRDFNTLYRNSSPKVKRESIRVKSPKISSKNTPKKVSKLSDKKLDKKTLSSGHKTPKSTSKTNKKRGPL